jgi:acyl-CoA dehydrogenase
MPSSPFLVDSLQGFQVIGVDAYREPSASKWSLSRQIRDVLSAGGMISEDRIRLGSGPLAQLPRRISLQDAIG